MPLKVRAISYPAIRDRDEKRDPNYLSIQVMDFLATLFRPRAISSDSSRVASGVNKKTPSLMRWEMYGAASQRMFINSSPNWLNTAILRPRFAMVYCSSVAVHEWLNWMRRANPPTTSTTLAEATSDSLRK